LWPGAGTAGGSLREHRLEPEQTHQPLGTLPIDPETILDLPRTKEWPLHGEAVALPHQGQVLGRLPKGIVIPAAPGQTNELALPGDA